MRASSLLAAVLILAPAAVRAGEATKAAPASQHAIDISTVALPIVWQGRVVNYVFTGVRVNLVPSADAMRLRTEKEPFLRDALVRAGHRTPFVIPWAFTQATPKQHTALPERPKPQACAAVGLSSPAPAV